MVRVRNNNRRSHLFVIGCSHVIWVLLSFVLARIDYVLRHSEVQEKGFSGSVG